MNSSAGIIYDSSEFSRLDSFVANQQKQMDLIDKEKAVQDKKVVQYALILAGLVTTIILFKKLVERNN